MDANERIQKTLAQNTNGYVDEKYFEGDLVLFKENDKIRWTGPAIVTGMEGNKVRIIHAGYDRTVPTCRVMHYNDKNDVVEDEEISSVVNDVETKEDDDATLLDQIEHESANGNDEVSNRDVRPKLHRKISFKVQGETLKGKVSFVRDVESWKY